MAARIILAAAIVLCAGYAGANPKEVVVKEVPRSIKEQTFNLNGANLKWPCKSTRNIYQQSGRYLSSNVIATRAQMSKNKVFVAMPRYKSGVPITLGYMDLTQEKCHASLAPYPCWSMQEEGNCDALQSVVDLYLDANDILWVLDSGTVNTLEQPVRRCPPKIVAFDINTGKAVKVTIILYLLIRTKYKNHSCIYQY